VESDAFARASRALGLRRQIALRIVARDKFPARWATGARRWRCPKDSPPN